MAAGSDDVQQAIAQLDAASKEVIALLDRLAGEVRQRAAA